MTKIKLCGLTRPQDIESANELRPDFIGFVFAKKSRRYVSPEKAHELKQMLDAGIRAVGVFVNEEPENVAELLDTGVIDIAQLHGTENEEYIRNLRNLHRICRSSVSCFRRNMHFRDLTIRHTRAERRFHRSKVCLWKGRISLFRRFFRLPSSLNCKVFLRL